MPQDVRTAYPEAVTFYTAMGVHAARKRSSVSGGWRLYILAKALDKQGKGMITRAALRQFAYSLGVSGRQFRRWMVQARNNDFMEDIQAANGEWMLILPSAARVAFAMGCDSVGNRRAIIQVRNLIGTGWRARVWAAFEAARGQQISRERLQKIANVPVSTQRYRDNQAGVKRQKHYAVSNLQADMLPAIKEYSNHKCPHVRRDGFIGWRLPDSRTTNLAIDAGQGRARKVNKALRKLQRQSGLFQMQRALSDDFEFVEFIRLFHATHDQLRASERKLAKSDNRRVRDLYEYSHKSITGAGIWAHCAF